MTDGIIDSVGKRIYEQIEGKLKNFAKENDMLFILWYREEPHWVFRLNSDKNRNISIRLIEKDSIWPGSYYLNIGADFFDGEKWIDLYDRVINIKTKVLKKSIKHTVDVKKVSKFLQKAFDKLKESKIETKKVYIYCRDEAKIEEILKYLFDNKINFRVVGNQALNLPEIEENKLNEFLEDDWFEVEQVKNMESFPKECFEDFGKGSKGMFKKSGPDKYIPIDTPKQKKRPKIENIGIISDTINIIETLDEGIITLVDISKNPLAVLMSFEEFESIKTILEMSTEDLIELYKEHKKIKNSDLSDYVDMDIDKQINEFENTIIDKLEGKTPELKDVHLGWNGFGAVLELYGKTNGIERKNITKAIKNIIEQSINSIMVAQLIHLSSSVGIDIKSSIKKVQSKKTYLNPSVKTAINNYLAFCKI